MKFNLSFLILILISCINAQSQIGNETIVEIPSSELKIEHIKGIDFRDSKTKQNIYFLGERSGLKDGKLIGLSIFKHQYTNNNVRLWIINEEPSYEYYLNKYLESGDKKDRQKVLMYSGLIDKKRQKLFVDDLYDFYINHSQKDFSISSTNLQLANEVSIKSALKDIFKTKGSIPSEIKEPLLVLEKHISGKVLMPSLEEINENLENILHGTLKQKDLYKKYLGNDFDVFRRIIMSYKTFYNFPLSSYSKKVLSARLEHCLSDLLSQFEMTNANVFMEIESPWIFLDNYIFETEEVDRKLIQNAIMKQLDIEIKTIGILYPKMNSEKCKDCLLGLSTGTLDYIKSNSVYPYTIFDMGNSENNYYNYIVSKRK